MAEGKGGGFSGWMIAVGTLLGGLSGIVAVITLVRDYDNPIARAILDDMSTDRSNRREIQKSYDELRQRDAAAWGVATQSNTPESYGAYVATYPGGAFVSDALARRDRLLEQRAWTSALRQNTIEAYDLYLGSYPTGNHATAARQNKARIQEQGGSVAFSLDAVAGGARPAVRRARTIAVYALEAQRRARAGVRGYFSGFRAREQSPLGGTFEGQSRQERTFLGVQIRHAVIGVWVFEPEDPSLPRSALANGLPVKGMRAQVLSTDMWKTQLSGELSLQNGTTYQGEFQTARVGTGFIMEGWGALWSSGGDLIGSGLWRGGELSH